jgi:hypothetical protein
VVTARQDHEKPNESADRWTAGTPAHERGAAIGLVLFVFRSTLEHFVGLLTVVSESLQRLGRLALDSGVEVSCTSVA